MLTSFVLLAGLLQAWDGRFDMNPDGVSYLDLAQAYRQQGWLGVVNGYWSPLYPFLLAHLALPLASGGAWLFPAVHLANWLLYVLCYACFRFALKQFQPDLIFELFAITLFASSTLTQIGLRVVTPDVCVAASLYLSIGLGLRIQREPRRRLLWVALGVSLGLGYLAKLILLPLGLAMALLLPLVVDLPFRQRWPALLLCLAAFAAVCSPMVAALSSQKGRFTAGEAGGLNYLWYVNAGGPQYFHWDGYPEGTGTPKRRPVSIRQQPAVVLYHGAGTSPGWFDPSFWHEGQHAKLELAKQMRVIYANVPLVLEAILQPTCLVAGFVSLLWLSWPKGEALPGIRAGGWVFLIAALGYGLYLAVHCEPRFFSGMTVILWLLLFSWSCRRASDESPVFARSILAGVLAALLIPLVTPCLPQIYRTLKEGVDPARSERHEAWVVARELARLGVAKSGDKLATVGFGFTAYYAPLARVQVAAEVDGNDEALFERLRPEDRNELYRTLRSNGITAVVWETRAAFPEEDWRRLGSRHMALLLTPEL